MKNIIFRLLLLVLVSSESFSQNESIEKPIFPKFPGGEDAIYKIIADSMIYPESALRDRIGGKVITEFIIDTLGNPIDIKVVQGVQIDIDDEAIRLIGLLHNWQPGTHNGKKIRVKYRLPLTFYPDKKWAKKYKKKLKG